MRLVEAEDLARRIGTVAEAVPYLALFVLLAAEQQMPIAVGIRDQRDRRFGLGKPGHVIEITVVTERVIRIAVARHLGRSRHESEAASGLSVHLLQERDATVAIDLAIVIHRGSLPKRSSIIVARAHGGLRLGRGRR